jgi:two-component sensor histidine kinase/CheY-like chemotaxis protein
MLALPKGTDILVADRSGQQLMNLLLPEGRPLPRRVDVVSVAKVFETGKPWISDLYVASSSKLTAGVNVPVFDTDGSALYNLSLELPAEEFTDILRSQNLPPTWFAAVLDRRGILAGRLPDPDRFVGKPAAVALREGVLRAPEGSVDTPTLEDVIVTSTWSRSNRSQWAVAVAMPSTEFAAPIRFQVMALIASSLVALAVSALLAFLFGRPIVRRLALLANRAEKFGDGSVAAAPPGGIKEIDVVRDAMDVAGSKIREQEQHLRLLIAELDHRVKNMLASVQAIALRTFGRSPDAHKFSGRLSALALAHSQLSKTLGRGSSLRPLVEAAIGAHRDAAGRIRMEGPDLVLNAKATQGLSLTLHELMTNSAKYGALSRPGGRVRIQWDKSNGATQRFTLRWSEHDGPPVRPPAQAGFGSFLIEKVLAEELGGTAQLTFAPTGVVFDLDVELAQVLGERDERTLASNPTGPVASLRPGSRVLLVEDETLIATQLMALLSGAGMRVTRAATLDEAEEAAAGTEFDAAVLDVNVNGHMIFPVAHRLKRSGTPIVFVTGYDFAGMWPQNLRHERRLGKPINEREILRVLGITPPGAGFGAAGEGASPSAS